MAKRWPWGSQVTDEKRVPSLNIRRLNITSEEAKHFLFQPHVQQITVPTLCIFMNAYSRGAYASARQWVWLLRCNFVRGFYGLKWLPIFLLVTFLSRISSWISLISLPRKFQICLRWTILKSNKYNYYHYLIKFNQPPSQDTNRAIEKTVWLKPWIFR